MSTPAPNGPAPVRALGAFIRDVGFPIFVATYLLLQVLNVSPKVDSMVRSLDRIAQQQERLLILLERR